MQHMRLLLNVFLIYSSTLYAMELTTTHIYNGIIITDDLFATSVCSRLDRPARDTIRCTCKKYYECIVSQDILNINYAKAFHLKKDDAQMLHWKSLGAFFPHQELAKAIKDKKYDLAKWLLEKNKVNVWNAYCRNIQDAIEEKKVEEILPLIRWLLNTREPRTHHNEFLSGYHYAINLKKKNPDVQKIIDVFDEYKKEQWIHAEKVNCLLPGFGRGPWHARGDYV